MQVYISNIEHVLSTVFNAMYDRPQQKKENEANNMIRLNLFFVEYMVCNKEILNNTQI